MPLSGPASALKSGLSAPAHFSPFQAISLRLASHGWPAGSQLARLYRMRRLAGQAQAQPRVLPRPLSLLSRRAIWLPACVQQPAKIQQALLVLPSSCSTAKPGICSPFFTSTLVGSAGSIRSASALPLISLASSSGEGAAGSR
ncbi:hypothetical protein D3C85_1535030 [compost metagenome]